MLSHTVVSDSVWPFGLWPARLFHPWDFSGYTGVGCQFPSYISPDPDAGEDWRQKKRGAEDEMVGWHHQLNGHELGRTPREAWDAAVHGAAESRTQLSDWTTTTNPLLFGFPSHLGPHRALSCFPVLYSWFSLVVCFIHSINSVCISTLIS